MIMNKRRKQHIATALLLIAALLIGVPVYAYSTQEQIEITQQENEAAEVNLASTEERLAQLEAQRGDSQKYLEELNTQLSELTAGMTILQEQLSQKEEEISQTEEELEAARADEAQQYEDMKLRIQYLYEESTSAGLLEALFSTDGFMEFLNRADAYAQITQYDREMLQTYSNTVSDIENKENVLEEERAELISLRDARLEQQEQIQAVYEAAYNELMDIEMSIQDSQSEISALTAQIAQQEEALNQLLIQKYEEEAAARAAEEAAEAAAAQAAAQAAASVQSSGSSGAAQSAGASSGSSQNTGSSSGSSSGGTQSSSTGNLTYLGNFKLTAYCSCEKCCGKWAANSGISASGAQCVEGVTVAMGGVPFGTKLSINGHIYTVQDRGTSYGHVDVYFSSHAAALRFGLQYADVYLVN